MPLEPTSHKSHLCLLTIGAELSAMTRRLSEIVSAPNQTQDVFGEITIIYSNIASLFVHLEGNERYLSFDPLIRYRDTIFRNYERNKQILELLSTLSYSDPIDVTFGHRWITWLREYTFDSDPDDRYIDFYASAKQVLHQIDQDQATLLQRLGVSAEGAHAAAVFYRIVSTTESLHTRSKLAQVWEREGERHLSSLTLNIDGMIAERRLQAEKNGYSSVAEDTFQRCSISKTIAWDFIQSYITRSLTSHLKLTAAIRKATGCLDLPMDHLGYYLRTLSNGTNLPQFKLDSCLDYLLSLAQALGITSIPIHDNEYRFMTIFVKVGNTKVGTICFDFLHMNEDKAALEAPSTNDKTDSADDRITYPTGHVLCRFQYGNDGTRRITFESVRSIFHEFGHAINHLLLRKRLPSHSGLEYLPIERLETLSMWFDKWIYHPEFADHLFLTNEERKGLFLCQRFKMIEFISTNLEGAVTAALDFEVHNHQEDTLEQAFRRLDDKFALSDYIRFERLPHYFVAPMFRANPSAAFVYLWGAADSAQKFIPFTKSNLNDVSINTRFGSMFGQYFDPEEPSVVPDIETVFSFYEAAICA